jgi:hypothetical protein
MAFVVMPVVARGFCVAGLPPRHHALLSMVGEPLRNSRSPDCRGGRLVVAAEEVGAYCCTLSWLSID